MARRTDPVAERPRHGVLGRYLLDGERILTAVHQHWAKVAEPAVSVVAGLVLVLALDSSLPATLGIVANLLWWAWFVLVGRALWKVLEWRHDWFVATDKRLILTHGLITQKVAMMPLVKVTDMSYNRSPLGRLLGYGTFVMESAGQDQALHRVEWVPQPDQTYRAICAEIFGVGVGVDDDDDDERVPDGPHGPHGGPDTTGYSTAIPIRITGPQPDDGGPDIHEADTGPISYRRPTS
ncbi:MAG: PH domain-containing protein [Dermatophilaceae bacterium]